MECARYGGARQFKKEGTETARPSTCVTDEPRNEEAAHEEKNLMNYKSSCAMPVGGLLMRLLVADG